MPTSAAQEEFDALIASSTTSRYASHPEDQHALDDESETASLSSTLASSTLRNDTNKPSLRASARTQSNDVHAEDYDDDDDYTPHPSTAAGRAGSKAYYVPRASSTRGEGQTGPKGVIADARAYEREQRNAQRVKAQGAQRVQHGFTVQDKLNGDEEGGSDEEEDDDDDELDSDAEIRRWKSARLAELKAQRSSMRSKPGGGLEFCGLERVDGMGYLDAVEGQGAVQKTVVVFIYAETRQRARTDRDDESEGEDEDEGASMDEASRKFAVALAAIAAKHSNARFIALHASEAEMEPAGVPALLAYRGGDMFARIVPLRDEVKLSSNIMSSLEECLHSHDII